MDRLLLPIMIYSPGNICPGYKYSTFSVKMIGASKIFTALNTRIR